MIEGNNVLISTVCQTKYSFYINMGKCCLKNQRVFINSILVTIKKSNNFIFCHLYCIPSCKTLSENWTVLLFWGDNQFHMLSGFLNIENVKILPYKVPKYQNNPFLGKSYCCMGIICLHTPTKSTLAVILRGQPSFYDHRFARYGFCCFFAPHRLFRAIFGYPTMTQNMAPAFSDSPRVI